MNIFSFIQREYILDKEYKNYKFYEKGYIFCNYPHDIIPLNTVINHLLDPELYKIINGDNNYGLLNKGLSYVPIIKQLMFLIGGTECSEENIIKKIDENKLIHIFLGGADEGLMNITNNQNNTKLCIKKRTGIFKIALKKGISIIPTYTFYNKNFTLDDDSNMLKIRTIFNQIMNIFPANKTLFVIGKPLLITKNENPSTSDILALRDRYIESIT